MSKQKPDLSLETAVAASCRAAYIAGLDEAGRGALAGPVVAAAVILPLDRPELLALLAQVNDSKQLPAAVRERLVPQIQQHALAAGIGSVPAAAIDQIGIIPATKRAMAAAVAALDPAPEFLLIDGRLRLTTPPLPQQSVIRGDSLSLSIAAASILAKVTRDRLLIDLDTQYPVYGFARHKGYGTVHHRQAIAVYGPCPEHRLTFAPLRHTLL